MAITLVTGVPGCGKTAFVVDNIIDQEGKRPIIVDGIPGLQLDADPAPPIKEWSERVPDDSSQDGEKLQFSFPVGSLVVIDECQRVFPRRAVGKSVPDYVACFETHRHKGLDFILITQHPRLLDSHIRSLVGRHVHIRQTWQGRHKYEWSECSDPESSSARNLAARDRYNLPKRAFTRYKSAELHTKTSFKLPFYFYMLAVGAIIAIGAFWYAYNSVKSKMSPKDALSGAPTVTDSRPVAQSGTKGPVLSKAEYYAVLEPRIPGLAHTAPLYDGVTTPQDAPIPVGCVQKAKSCRCIDQQGNNYATTMAVCEGFVNNGLFVPWRNVEKERQEQAKLANDKKNAERRPDLTVPVVRQMQPEQPPV